jgi:hypothetical protein
MPRKKIAPPAPISHGFTNESEDSKREILEITPESVNFGSGAAKKVKALQDFEVALSKIADEYYFGSEKAKSKIAELIDNSRQNSALKTKLELMGIDLEDRAMRDLAKKIKKAIKEIEEAKKACK